MTRIENLLSRLQRVKGRNGSWTACCPAHDDRGPSLAVRQADDGRILMHCFAGCETLNVLGAIGLDMTDLFPEKQTTFEPKPAVKPAFYASDLLRIIGFEAMVVQIVAFDMAHGKKPSAQDRERLLLAYERIDEAVRFANV